MKTNQYVYLCMATVAALVLAGCTTYQGRPDYTASGALAGGATGAVIGSMAHHSGPSTLVGAAVGAVAGGLIGHSLDQAQEAQLQAQAPQTLQRVEQGQPLTVGDIKALARAGISDDLIISQIRNSRTVYHLTTSEIIDLKHAGVSDRVIDYMINTPSQMPSAEVGGVVGSAPPPAAAPTSRCGARAGLCMDNRRMALVWRPLDLAARLLAPTDASSRASLRASFRTS